MNGRIGIDEMWLIFSFALAFVVTFGITPPVINFAHKVGAVDHPKDARRMHSRPIARIGGLGIFYGFAVSVLCFAVIDMPFRGILIGSFIIVSLGLLDDIFDVKAIYKLLVQIGAAIIPVIHGVVVERLAVPIWLIPSGYLEFGWFAPFVTVVWIVGVTNAVNLIDGLDGLAAGVSSISSITLFCIALLVSENNVAIITAALAGSCFGFLPHNSSPAKVFMGDTGATFLGFTLSTVSVMGLFKGYAIITFAVPLLVLGLPIFDTAFAIIRRIAGRRPIMSADRGHLHHRLIDLGFSQKQTVWLLYILSTILGLSAVVLAQDKGVLRVVFLFAAAIGAIVFAAQNVDIPENNEATEDNQDETED